RIHTLPALPYRELLAARMTETIDPADVIESRRLDHECLVVFAADRVTRPLIESVLVQSAREIASINVDAPQRMVVLEDLKPFLRTRHELHGSGDHEQIGHAWRQTFESRVVRV